MANDLIERFTLERDYTCKWHGSAIVELESGDLMNHVEFLYIRFPYYPEAAAFTRWFWNAAEAPSPETERRWKELLGQGENSWDEFLEGQESEQFSMTPPDWYYPPANDPMSWEQPWVVQRFSESKATFEELEAEGIVEAGTCERKRKRQALSEARS